MPLRPWVARTNAGMHPTTRQYPLATGEVPRANDIVHLNASGEVVRTVSADPTPILGLCEDNADPNSNGPMGLVHEGFVSVTVFTNDLILAMEGSRAPLATDVGVAYGIARDADGVWTVDATETINTRVHVVDYDAGRNLWFVKVLEAHRQSPE